MGTNTTISKDPADVYDVVADHSRQMAVDDADTITASQWRIPGSADDADQPVDGWLQLDDAHTPAFTDETATVWVTGGTEGYRYELINTVTTAGGRTWERTIHVRVTDQ